MDAHHGIHDRRRPFRVRSTTELFVRVMGELVVEGPCYCRTSTYSGYVSRPGQIGLDRHSVILSRPMVL